MDLTTKTLAELRAIAKEKGLKGVTALRKPELAAKIAEVMQAETERQKPVKKAVKPAKEKETPKKEVQKNAAKGNPYTNRNRTYRNATQAEHKPEYHKPEYHKPEHHRQEYQKPEYHQEQRAERTAQSINYYNNQKQRYHDGTDGLISVMRDRQIADVHPTELKEVDSGVTKNGILDIISE